MDTGFITAYILVGDSLLASGLDGVFTHTGEVTGDQEDIIEDTGMDIIEGIGMGIIVDIVGDIAEVQELVMPPVLETPTVMFITIVAQGLNKPVMQGMLRLQII